MSQPALRLKTPALGRPRDAALDSAILRAAMELVAESGVAGATMDAVALRAGAGKAALYRRWPSKEDLLADAMKTLAPAEAKLPAAATASSSLRDDLHRLYEQHYGVGDRVLEAAAHQFLVALRNHPKLLAALEARSVLSNRRNAARALFQQALARGEIAPETDIDTLADLVPSLLSYRANVVRQRITRTMLTRLVDEVVMPLARVVHT